MIQTDYNSVMIKNFIFDLYNTLIDVKTDEHCERAWRGVTEFFGERGIKTDWHAVMREFDGYWARFRAENNSEYEYPECDCVTQFASMAERLGGTLTREEATHALRLMRKASIERLRLFDGTAELLDEMRSKGARLYLLSNAQSAFTAAEIADVGLTGKFDGMLLSSDCGCRKPDVRFFGMLFDRFGLKKTESVMIGDDAESDGAGAAAFGIRFIHVPGGAAAHVGEIMRALRP